MQIYDYRQMFDAMFLEEAISDLYDAGCKDDNLMMMYKANYKRCRLTRRHLGKSASFCPGR